MMITSIIVTIWREGGQKSWSTSSSLVVPVSDVDRAKDFYVDKMGFTLDVDHQAGDVRSISVRRGRRPE